MIQKTKILVGQIDVLKRGDVKEDSLETLINDWNSNQDSIEVIDIKISALELVNGMGLYIQRAMATILYKDS